VNRIESRYALASRVWRVGISCGCLRPAGEAPPFVSTGRRLKDPRWSGTMRGTGPTTLASFSTLDDGLHIYGLDLMDGAEARP